MTSMKLKIAAITCCLLISLQAFAERAGLDGIPGIAFDFPELTYIQDNTADKKTYVLANQVAPVTIVVKYYNYGQYGTTMRALDETASKLKVKAVTSTVEWRCHIATTAMISGTVTGKTVTGYAAAVNLPFDKGTVVIMDWCDSKDKSKFDCFMLSVLDSIFIDTGSYYEPGLMTKWKYPDSSNTVPVTLNIDGKTINTQLNAADKLASEYLVNREYEVLYLYNQQNNETAHNAWIRYYRMIFKDSYKRLERASFDIYNALYSDCADETDLAQKLLTWTQNFNYERQKNKSDFASLPAILLGSGSDCDSRSLLIAVLLTGMNEDAVLFVSDVYSHAMAGFVSSHPGHAFKVNGKDYLMGETTAKGLTWGRINASQDDQKNWVTVQLP